MDGWRIDLMDGQIMDGWMDGWMIGWKDGWMEEWEDGFISWVREESFSAWSHKHTVDFRNHPFRSTGIWRSTFDRGGI